MRPHLISVFSLLGVVSVIAAIVIPNLRGARKHGNEALAIDALFTIASAQSRLWAAPARDARRRYGSLADLHDRRLIDCELAAGATEGYALEVWAGPTTWMAVARPVVPGTTGDRHFAVTQSGVVHYRLKPIALNTTGALAFDARLVGR